MSLVLLVYAVSLLNSAIVFFVIMAIIGGAIMFFVAMEASELSKLGLTLFLVGTITSGLIPSEKTAWTMVGAYATQRLVEDPDVRRLSGKVLKVIEDKLDQYAKTPKPAQ